MKKLLTVLLILTVAFAAFANGETEKADDAWAKTVDVIVPAKAGGGTDLAARAMWDYIAKQEGNNIGIVNNDTGNCVVAFEETRTAQTDGSKILFFNGGFLTRIASGIYNHKVEEFTPIAVFYGSDPAYALLVSSESDIKTIEDLKAAASSREVVFGCNIGGTTQVMANDLAKAMGVNFKVVMSGSDTTALTELVGRSIDVCYVNVNQARQYVESGKAVALGILGQDNTPAKRSPVLPDVPNMNELGYDVSFGVYFIVAGPKGMSTALVQKIYNYLVAATQDPEVRALLEPSGLLSDTFTPFDEMADVLKKAQDSYIAAFAN
jgi:putative tricarboxylic transport membrane protein